MADAGDSWEDLDDEDLENQFERVEVVYVPPTQSVEPTPKVTTCALKPSVKESAAEEAEIDNRPLILVDLTALSDGKIHNKFDKFGCNDAEAKREYTRKIESDYQKYANDAKLISSGVVRPCGYSVWRPALAALRDEVPGHFFAPIFPPS
ncbi:hypothetical protein CYMTET_28022 [Cymbomonas tetramitiformis]|uniref:Uncharacterized protein n=1 Tax=Cymbomonas tetramitiformis TaxID=36881 RepID=A0AAE0FP85_9CHLO|nr:hypothetical protein CYMTET_28022 [Cymbomonas tetramitiformis]|eukprot:gene9448-11191_t